MVGKIKLNDDVAYFGSKLQYECSKPCREYPFGPKMDPNFLNNIKLASRRAKKGTFFGHKLSEKNKFPIDWHHGYAPWMTPSASLIQCRFGTLEGE